MAAAAAGLWPRSEAKAQPQKGGRLHAIVQPEPSLLVLGLNLQSATQMVAGKIYQGLLTYDARLRPQPALATAWTISEDGLTYTFLLNRNVRWHDGQPFTADDVVFATTKFLPSTHPVARNNFSRVTTVEAPDPHVVVFRLAEPFSPFIMAFATGSAPMLPKHIYDGTDYRTNAANATPIGTGPFKFKQWKKGQYIQLTRNEDYWKPRQPYLDDIFFHVIPDASSRALALEDKTIDLASFSDIEPADVPRLRKRPYLEVTSRGYEYFSPLSWIEINHRVAPLGDKRFRQALMLALDRQFIADRIFFGQAKPAVGPISSTMRFFDARLPAYPYDPTRAETLLDSMGLTRDAAGRRATIKLLALPYGETWTRVAEYIRQALQKVGISIVLETVDAGAWAQRVANWEFELTLDFTYQLGDPAIGVSRTYISSNIRKGVLFSNTMGYRNSKIDELFAQAAIVSADHERAALYSQIQNILVDEVPVAWLVELQFPTIFNIHVHDLIVSSTGVNDSFDEAYRDAI